MYKTLGGHRAGEAAIVYEHGADVEALMPKLQKSDYLTLPRIHDSKKHRVGQGLNKPAEVTLLNIKCFDKKTGQQYTGGPRIEKYKEMLKRKAEDQGAEFVSYDANKGEWKFRVNHFSVYKLVDEDS
jgi:nuclear pore complex protein Nup98-Nup96